MSFTKYGETNIAMFIKISVYLILLAEVVFCFVRLTIMNANQNVLDCQYNRENIDLHISKYSLFIDQTLLKSIRL